MRRDPCHRLSKHGGLRGKRMREKRGVTPPVRTSGVTPIYTPVQRRLSSQPGSQDTPRAAGRSQSM